MDGAETIFANALQIEVRQETFDRRVTTGGTEERGDPPVSWFFEVANGFLSRFRSALQAPHVRPIEIRRSIWHLEYLSDDGMSLPREADKIREAYAVGFRVSMVGLNAGNWGQVLGMPVGSTPRVWETLLLDAEDILPEIGPAIVLANTALETVIERVLRILAQTRGLPDGLWEWINDRDNAWKGPSESEQFDKLLKILGDVSLKENGPLWETFKNLRKARNTFVHEGVAKIGDVEVTGETAALLVGGARKIIDWIEPLLPAEVRRTIVRAPIEYRNTRTLVAPAETETEA